MLSKDGKDKYDEWAEGMKHLGKKVFEFRINLFTVPFSSISSVIKKIFRRRSK